ncbi:MAG: diacylglycerol kinase, partial [Hasllibacter sp.]
PAPVGRGPVKHGDEGGAPAGRAAYFWHRLKLRWRWSAAGIALTWREEYSFRSWVWAHGASVALTLILPLSAGERGLIWALGFLVLASELFNSAIERVVDLAQPERDPLAGAAKDAASGGVMLTAFAAGAAWIAVLLGLALGG